MIALAALLALQSTARPKMSAWLVFYDNGESMASFRSHATTLDTVSPEWIGCDLDGHVFRRPNPTADQKKDLMAVARANHVRVLGMASNAMNGDFTAVGVEKALASEDRMRAHAAGLVKIAREEGLDGIDLDYELLAAKDRKPFAKFVSILAGALHQNHLMLAMALHPKDSEPGTWDGAQAQDYASLGKSADFLRVMTYDQHWSTSEAGPVASPDWVERVAKFAASQIPAQKLELGLPGYGYDWVGKKANDVTWAQFNELTRAHGAPRRDKASLELTLTYDNHSVFYPDGEAAVPKFKLVRRMGLRGLALWRLGCEDPAIWALFTGAGSRPHGG